MSEAAAIRIGAWTVHPALNQLERGTRTVRIEPRAMDVLMFLAGRAGEVVSVDELIASVWKGVVVGDGSVYLAIRQVRQALEDAADGTRYIETIPKRGYRLLVPVERTALASTAGQSASQAPEGQQNARAVHRRLAFLFAAVIACGVFALVLRSGILPARTGSVAVLPFENLSSDPEQTYFAHGITAEILNTLSHVRGLRVTGRTSSFRFQGRGETLSAIGEALGVEHVLEGSVRKSGDQVRVTAQLSNVRTGDQLWSETYERRLEDIFLIQDEIAKSVADALQVRLGVGDVAHIPGMTRNVSAYDEYLRGMALNLDWQAQSFPLAIAHLQRAVALDPSFSVAWAGLHTVYANGAFVVPERAEEWRRKGAEALDRARALTPYAPHVLLESGIREARAGHWNEAAAIFEQLQASYARYDMDSQAWGPRGIFLLAVGRVREAVPDLERARAEDPLAPAFAGFLAYAKLADGDLAGALGEVDRGLRLDGLETSLLRTGFVIALNQGNRAEIDRRLGLMTDDVQSLGINRRLAGFIDAPAGAAIEIRRLATTANLADKTMLAQWAAYYHEPELSLALLADVAPELSHPGMLWQPLFDEVRKLPAFKDLVRALGFVDYWRAHGWSDFCRPGEGADFVCA